MFALVTSLAQQPFRGIRFEKQRTLVLQRFIRKGIEKMKEKLDKAFRTFPLESTEKTDSETKIPRVPCPSLEDVEAAKEWVDFKEM